MPDPLTHAWGRSWLLHSDDRTALFRFEGRKGGASSLHYHEGKDNIFIVTRGALKVAFNGFEVLVGPGQSVRVPAWVPHRMRMLADVAGYELYEAAGEDALRLEDITRLEPGWTPEGAEWVA